MVLGWESQRETRTAMRAFFLPSVIENAVKVVKGSQRSGGGRSSLSRVDGRR